MDISAEDKDFFSELGIKIPKTEFTVDIPDDIQEDANNTFAVYSAYLKAGFHQGEALELIKALVAQG